MTIQAASRYNNGPMGNNNLNNLIKKAQREAVEKTFEYLKDIIDTCEVGSQVIDKIRRLTPEKILGGEE